MDNESGRRTTINIPPLLDELIHQFKKRSGSPSWNAALWEIVRAGLLQKISEQELLEKGFTVISSEKEKQKGRTPKEL